MNIKKQILEYPRFCDFCSFLGLCPDWEDWDPKDSLKNAKEAMDLAQDWLGVPQVSNKQYVSNGALFFGKRIFKMEPTCNLIDCNII